ncbi:SGNH/GDSL hydrolase family protein [Cohnella sp. GCM10027633]|uniref:SGNH/GDSL hydrolase family protein n=1 Tax=unclassified Cohnella TaxID=2636738 RepID=UPI003639C77B
MGDWQGATCAWHGDSISRQDGCAYDEGAQAARGYQTYAKEQLGFGRIDTHAIGGRPMANGTDRGEGICSIIRDTDNDADLVVIAGGTNDFRLNVPIGELGATGDISFDDCTFYGALRSAIEHMLTVEPTRRIALFTPLQRGNAPYDVNYVNAAGHRLVDYADAIARVGAMYAIPVYDAYRTSGITQLNLRVYTLDGLHPNDAGYERIARTMIPFLRNLGGVSSPR